MEINRKTEREQLQDKLESARLDLIYMSKYDGNDAALKANIEHKKRFIMETEARLREMDEEGEAE